MNEYAKDERIIVPYFKMLDYILERNEIQKWSGCQLFGKVLYDIIIKETRLTKSILKVAKYNINLIIIINFFNNKKKK